MGVLWAGILPGLLAPIVMLLSTRLFPARPSLTDPVQLTFFLSAVARPSFYSDVRPGLLYFTYLVGLGVLSAILLLRLNGSSATGQQALVAGLITGGMNMLLSLPGAFWSLTGIFLWFPGATATPLLAGLFAWLALSFIRAVTALRG